MACSPSGIQAAPTRKITFAYWNRTGPAKAYDTPPRAEPVTDTPHDRNSTIMVPNASKR